MRFIANKTAKSGKSAFTLMEVLAALLFMAIVIPVAVEGLRIANLAGEVGLRKTVAARIGQSVIEELRVTGQMQNALQSGAVQEGVQHYRWTMRVDTWPEDAMRLATVNVVFPVQGRDYNVQLSTLVGE